MLWPNKSRTDGVIVPNSSRSCWYLWWATSQHWCLHVYQHIGTKIIVENERSAWQAVTEGFSPGSIFTIWFFRVNSRYMLLLYSRISIKLKILDGSCLDLLRSISSQSPRTRTSSQVYIGSKRDEYREEMVHAGVYRAGVSGSTPSIGVKGIAGDVACCRGDEASRGALEPHECSVCIYTRIDIYHGRRGQIS